MDIGLTAKGIRDHLSAAIASAKSDGSNVSISIEDAEKFVAELDAIEKEDDRIWFMLEAHDAADPTVGQPIRPSR